MLSFCAYAPRSIGDTFNAKGNSTKDSFLPDVTTNELAEQTNACLRDAVRRDGKAYIQHLDSFIVALREELDSPGGLSARNPPAEERRLYRIDVNRDGTGQLLYCIATKSVWLISGTVNLWEGQIFPCVSTCHLHLCSNRNRKPWMVSRQS